MICTGRNHVIVGIPFPTDTVVATYFPSPNGRLSRHNLSPSSSWTSPTSRISRLSMNQTGFFRGTLKLTPESVRPHGLGLVNIAAGTRIASTARNSILAASVIRAERAAFRAALIDAGKLSQGQKAHHIVEMNDPVSGITVERLIRLGIHPNDPVNGIGLTNHPGRHSVAYSQAVQGRITRTCTGEEAVLELNDIGRELSRIDNDISKGSRAENSAPEAWASEQNR